MTDPDAKADLHRYLIEAREALLGKLLPFLAGNAEPNADTWAAPDESREDVIGLWHRVGWRRTGDTFVEGDEAWWAAYRERLESIARGFA